MHLLFEAFKKSNFSCFLVWRFTVFLLLWKLPGRCCLPYQSVLLSNDVLDDNIIYTKDVALKNWDVFKKPPTLKLPSPTKVTGCDHILNSGGPARSSLLTRFMLEAVSSRLTFVILPDSKGLEGIHSDLSYFAYQLSRMPLLFDFESSVSPKFDGPGQGLELRGVRTWLSHTWFPIATFT